MTYPNTPGSVTGSDTSEAAAVQIGMRVEAQRKLVRDTVIRLGSATCDDVSAALNDLKSGTVAARIRELSMFGLLRVLSRRRNKQGKSVRLYEACDVAPDFTPVAHSNPYVGHSSTATRNNIMAALAIFGPSTFAEISDNAGLLPQTTTPAIADMLLLGLIYDTGQRRITRYGGKARVVDLKVQCP